LANRQQTVYGWYLLPQFKFGTHKYLQFLGYVQLVDSFRWLNIYFHHRLDFTWKSILNIIFTLNSMKIKLNIQSVAMYTVAAICISPLGGMLSNIIGRRKCFIILTIISIIGYITMALSPNFPALFVGRSLTIVSASGMSAIIGTKFTLFFKTL